ncbi:protein-glutamate methylesterase/protein-glutamine glutaminase [Pontibacillus marinus]|uniref:Protein-glutamate methylesterase/protein-glutamine glutaminase n=1 Tax=Pontibacillus marinus BH030004 = DSM 16465 TaxID=1385511 RepID=A0A0A5G9B4_9BACI|nr:chemotaxis response regulator protein-glutamate methylesterase [Pontibacillus marinus]KGX88619.1 chemotaxis protein CheY [Pontibacillus marinus BH030004 = DSM 16465]
MKGIRVLVIDDSAFMRKMITDILDEDSRLTVIGTARNGEDGLRKIRELSPDVVTLDIEMPIMDGLDCLQQIMKDTPLPVVMLSSLTAQGAESTMKAMEYGAIDFIQKPSGAISLDIETIQEEITKKVFEAANVNVERLITQHKEETSTIPFTPKKTKLLQQKSLKKLIAIGASTGGPRALQKVLMQLPEDLPAPVLIVQHMPQGFTKSLANRLNTLCQVHVKEAENGEVLQKGTVYIAPGDFHMTVRKVGMSLAIQLSQTPERLGHRPSVDVMFESLLGLNNYETYAIVLTGMGSDGARGLEMLKKKSEHVVALAESSESSVVYGMPKAAFQTNQVDHVVHLNDVTNTVMKLIGE